MWLYRSPIGPIFIVRLSNGRYGMMYNNTVWESCSTPQEEADNVYMQVTGCYKWDCFNAPMYDVPYDLSEWEFIG